MAKTTQENTTNRFTKNEYVAYKLQIWRDTFNVCLNASGGRDVAMATNQQQMQFLLSRSNSLLMLMVLVHANT